MDDMIYAPNLACIHNCSNCRVDCKSMKNVRKIYWELHRKSFGNVPDMFHKITGLQWHEEDSSHKCSKHQIDRYIPGSCNSTLCDIMSPTPTEWFEISSTWRMTEFSYYIHEHLSFRPYISSIMDANTFKPTKVLCVRTGMVVPGTACDAYFAVSHVWSSSNFVMVDRELSQNSKEYPWFGKLSLGSKGYPWLKRMSKLLKIKYAWIDTCCIDQENADEKKHEIGNMREYYRNAQACAVLHSADVKDIDDFISSMRILSVNATQFVRPAHSWALACIRYSKLLTDAWFTRIWTVQEAVLSKELVIDSSCGLVDMKELLRCYNIIVRIVGGIPMCDDKNTVRMLSEFIGFGAMDMETILKLCANRQAKFKHDYIYGILGMLPNIQMDIDYTIPIKQVATQLYRALIKCGDISWLSWIGSSCIDRGRKSWIPTIGSSMIFAEWNNGIALTYNRNLMDIFCSETSVEVLGGSTSDKMYTINFQPVITLCELSYNTGKCIGCITEMFCNRGCCRSWMIVKLAKEAEQIYFVVCNNCLMQRPDSTGYDSCKQHISKTFYRTLGSRLWLTASKTDDTHILVLAWKPDGPRTKATDIRWTEEYLLYGKRVEAITKYTNAKVFTSGNFGWLVSRTMERLGVVVACSKTYTMSDVYTPI
jgi:hypothetical protein